MRGAGPAGQGGDDQILDTKCSPASFHDVLLVFTFMVSSPPVNHLTDDIISV